MLLAKPYGSVSGSKIFTQIPRRRLPPAGFCGARFAPRSSQSLAAPFRGAESSHRFRAAACPLPVFAGRDVLPAPRKALRLRSGEQNLHTDSAPPSVPGRFLRGAICSPLLAKPCSSVSGSKIFTQIPRRRLPPAVLRIKKRRTLFCSWLFDDLRHLLHDLLVESIQGIPDGLEEVRGAAGVVPVPGGH